VDELEKIINRPEPSTFLDGFSIFLLPFAITLILVVVCEVVECYIEKKPILEDIVVSFKRHKQKCGGYWELLTMWLLIGWVIGMAAITAGFWVFTEIGLYLGAGFWWFGLINGLLESF